MACQVDSKIRLRPFELYQTAIQLMYDIALRSYTEEVAVVDSRRFQYYDVLILIVNPQPREATQQLQIMHCAAALYEAITIMTEGIIFSLMRCLVIVLRDEVGALSITPWDSAVLNTSVTNQTIAVDDSWSNVTTELTGGNDGQIRDPDDPSFVINYHFFGKTINSKSVSMAIFEAMTAAVPYEKDSRCRELSVLSPDGVCAIIVEGVPSYHQFTYRWATRALKLLYQKIVVPQKRFGDVYLELKYNAQGVDEKFGELRMLKVVGGENFNDTNAVASA